MGFRQRCAAGAAACAFLGVGGATASGLAAETAARAVAAPVSGPFDIRSVSGSAGVSRDLPTDAPVLAANAPFTISAWMEGASAPGGVLLASLGHWAQPQARRLGLDGAGRPTLDLGGRVLVAGGRPIGVGPHLVAASFDGSRARLFVDGAEAASAPASLPALPPPPPDNEWQKVTVPKFEIAPRPTDTAANQHFAGTLRRVALYAGALAPAALRGSAAAGPPTPVIGYEETAKPWPVQVRQQAGYDAPQPPDTLPTSAASVSKPVAKPPYAGPALPQAGAGRWTLSGGWTLASAPDVKADGAAISRAGFDASRWLAATVPGTVLTTLVDRGVYPDPAYGLNNLAIPESLNTHDWWYRAELDAPAALAGKRAEIVFNGINYAGEVWLNGARLGTTTGAFIRGRFDVTGRLKPGARNVVAVRVSPPPHPGIPNEQSIKGGVGENGGMMMLDGPTFGATEGWDWIPGVRDRNTGLWQDVELHATGEVRLGDPRVVTTLPLPDRSSADVAITAALTNFSASPVKGELVAAFDDVRVSKRVTLAPGTSAVTLAPAEFAALRVKNPKLWWPNGYGEPALHPLKLTFATAAGVSDERDLKFGIREITYELSAFDKDGALRRVAFDPAKADGKRLIAGSHEGIHDAGKAFAVSLAEGAEGSPGLKLLPDDPLSPFLVVRVNGERIAIRGGAWGMDDFMKRVGRDRLEPYFRLNRDAHMNILRNWVGQDTEEALYDLADQYGILVWNDFWESTQDYNLEAQDPALFLANAADVVSRFRNHPSIMVWIGRNEGVPQPILNAGLETITRELDGTRYYAGSSNRINLQNSGPYSYRPDEDYFTTLSKGYAVEVGLASFSTLESFKASVPPSEQWPITDTWAYHDWHQSGNGDTHGFMAALTAKFGAPTSLEDFERKAQMLNYDSHRAVFEGMNARLWTQDSGRMLWMTQPAWPSNVWQIYSSDYDTHASYYGAMKAAEPVHIQLDRPDGRITVTDTTTEPLAGATARARVFALDGRKLAERSQPVSVPAGGVVHGDPLDLAPLMANGPVLVKLDLTDARGALLSENLYWRATDAAAMRRLGDLPKAALGLQATAGPTEGGERVVTVRLSNPGASPALSIKLTLQDGAGARVLPAYYSDNYVSLLPGEARDIRIRYPAGGPAAAGVALRGWNATAEQAAVR